MNKLAATKAGLRFGAGIYSAADVAVRVSLRLVSKRIEIELVRYSDFSLILADFDTHRFVAAGFVGLQGCLRSRLM